MICSLEERVCNLVLLWCITVIAHHCKLVKLQSTVSDYNKQSDLWNYDDIEYAKPQNETYLKHVKTHHSNSYEHRNFDSSNYRDELPAIIRGHGNTAVRTSIDVPIGLKMNDGEILISKKITFNGNNSRSNNHPLWFNTLEKSAMSLPPFPFNNFKNPYAERKIESTKRPYEGGSIYTTKTIPFANNTANRNKIKYQPNYEPEYDEPSLPPSLPNLEIIPFVASDALDKPKDTIDRKESIEYAEETTPIADSESQIKKFSPPVRTEGGFVPRDPSLDDLFFNIEYNRTYSTPKPTPEITSELQSTESYLSKISDLFADDTESSPSTSETLTSKVTASTTEQINITQTNIHFIETTTNNTPVHFPFSSTNPVTLPTEESNISTEPEPEPIKPNQNNTKDETNDQDDNFLLSNLLTMIFDDYPANPTNKEKTTTNKKPTSSTPSPRPTTIPPFKHLYIASTENTTSKIEFNSTKLFVNNNTVINETQQNQIKYISHSTTPKTTAKPIEDVKVISYSNEIFSSMKTNSVISGLLKLSGCNIFGKMYKTGEIIEELSEPCSRCICSEAGVHCIPVKC